MSRDSVHLLDILKAGKLALSYLKGKTKEEFLRDNPMPGCCYSSFRSYWGSCRENFF
jgi:hypothetical protein